MPRKPSTHRVDQNQEVIEIIAETHGWEVARTTALGGGFPDFVAWHPVKGFALVEVKNGRQKLRATQERFQRRFRMPVVVISSDVEANDFFGGSRR